MNIRAKKMPERYVDFLANCWDDAIRPRESSAPTVVSLFSGAGGSVAGYALAGYREVMAVEWDSTAAKTLARNFAHIRVYCGDIARLSDTACLEMAGLKPGELALLDASPPCFPAGTRVITRDGPMDIETVKVGDLVLTHAGAYRPVTEIYRRAYAGELTIIEPSLGRSVSSTPNHPFLVNCKAGTALDIHNKGTEWVVARELKVDDLLFVPAHPGGQSSWISIRRVDSTSPINCQVYNLEVQGDHSYTANSYAVHNCQGFSSAGKGRFSDGRNSLFNEYIRLLKALKPKCFIAENVFGMVMGNKSLLFARYLSEMRQAGYDVIVRLMDSQYFQVPQARKRLIFIGTRHDLGVPPSHPRPASRPITVASALDGVKAKSFRRITGKSLAHWSRIKPGESMGNFKSRKKINPSRPCNTQCAGSAHYHWDEAREMSLEEQAILQSFPQQFEFVGSHSAIQRQIGNSVPPLMMYHIARNVRKEILDKCG